MVSALAIGIGVGILGVSPHLCRGAGWEPPNDTDMRAAYCKVVVDDFTQPLKIALAQGANSKKARALMQVKRSIDAYLLARPELDPSGLRAAALQARSDLDALHDGCSKETATCAEGAKTKDAMEACFVRGQQCVQANPELRAARDRTSGCLGKNWMFVP